MPGQELAPRADSPLVTPTLTELGVAVVEDADTGARAIVIPDELRKSANVLLPVSSVAQAVELVRPSIRAARLDPSPDGAHFYKQKQKLAPTKQALETLAHLAGITLARTRTMSAAELSAYEEGTIGYEATVAIRRPDGTLHEVSASKVWQPTVEARKIRQAVGRMDNVRNPDAVIAERWLTEREFGPAKTESKAVLRAIRAALQIPHSFTPADAAKPFVVVGYDLALDYTDPEVVRLLLEGRERKTAELYGPAPVVEESPAPADVGGKPADGSPEPEAERDAEEEPDAEVTTPVAEASAPPAFEGEEPPEPEADPEPPEAVPSDVVLPDDFKRYAGQTVADVAAAGDKAYLRFMATKATDERIRAAAKIALEGLS